MGRSHSKNKRQHVDQQNNRMTAQIHGRTSGRPTRRWRNDVIPTMQEHFVQEQPTTENWGKVKRGLHPWMGKA